MFQTPPDVFQVALARSALASLLLALRRLAALLFACSRLPILHTVGSPALTAGQSLAALVDLVTASILELLRRTRLDDLNHLNDL